MSNLDGIEQFCARGPGNYALGWVLIS